jgi:hypothetical protein
MSALEGYNGHAVLARPLPFLHFSDAAGLTDDVGSWGKADSQPTSRKRREGPISDLATS